MLSPTPANDARQRRPIGTSLLSNPVPPSSTSVGGGVASSSSSSSSSSNHNVGGGTAMTNTTSVVENAAELSLGREFDDVQILSNAQVAVILQMSAQNALVRDEELHDVYKRTQKYVERYNTMKNNEKEHQELVDELDNLQGCVCSFHVPVLPFPLRFGFFFFLVVLPPMGIVGWVVCDRAFFPRFGVALPSSFARFCTMMQTVVRFSYMMRATRAVRGEEAKTEEKKMNEKRKEQFERSSTHIRTTSFRNLICA
jgi:hypothetical protein